MSEQIDNNVNGIIVYELTSNVLAEAIRKLIDRPELRERFVNRLQEEDVCHYGEINKLYEMFEN